MCWLSLSRLKQIVLLHGTRLAGRAKDVGLSMYHLGPFAGSWRPQQDGPDAATAATLVVLLGVEPELGKRPHDTAHLPTDGPAATPQLTVV